MSIDLPRLFKIVDKNTFFEEYRSTQTVRWHLGKGVEILHSRITKATELCMLMHTYKGPRGTRNILTVTITNGSEVSFELRVIPKFNYQVTSETSIVTALPQTEEQFFMESTLHDLSFTNLEEMKKLKGIFDTVHKIVMYGK